MTNGDLDARPVRPDRAAATQNSTQNGMTLQAGMATNGHISMPQTLVRLVGCRDPQAHASKIGPDRPVIRRSRALIKLSGS